MRFSLSFDHLNAIRTASGFKRAAQTDRVSPIIIGHGYGRSIREFDCKFKPKAAISLYRYTQPAAERKSAKGDSSRAKLCRSSSLDAFDSQNSWTVV